MIEFDIIPLELQNSFKTSTNMKHIYNRVYSNIEDDDIINKYIKFVDYKLHTEFISLMDELSIQICKSSFGVKIEFSLVYKSKVLSLFEIIPDEKICMKQFMYKKHLFYVNRDEPNIATTKVYYILDYKNKEFESNEKFRDCIYFCHKHKNIYPINVCVLNNSLIEISIIKTTPKLY